ncbi:MAG: hypothetical protein CMF62_12680 [Magnetococcales bacterium]|nr:hypothetical protein [Magnetococcales bacterium]
MQATNNDKPRTHCLVCGFDFGQEVIREDDCPCCGFFMGYFWEDAGLEHIRIGRLHWIEKQKARWDSPAMQPAEWSVDKAWAQVRANVPKKFQ